jgi:hypothetical protein
MGEVIKIEDFKGQKDMISHLIIYDQKVKELPSPAISISKELSKCLLAIPPKSRTMRLSASFKHILAEYQEPVIIQDIDVMFNPAYKVDVLRILTEVRKAKCYSTIWPGRIERGLLIYSEEGYPDYRVFKIADYDVTCVIQGGNIK